MNACGSIDHQRLSPTQERAPLHPLTRFFWSLMGWMVSLLYSHNRLDKDAFRLWISEMGQEGSLKLGPTQGYCVGISLDAIRRQLQGEALLSQATPLAYQLQKNYLGKVKSSSPSGESLLSFYRKHLTEVAKDAGLDTGRTFTQFTHLPKGSYLVQTIDHVIAYFVTDKGTFFLDPDRGRCEGIPEIKNNFEILKVTL